MKKRGIVCYHSNPQSLKYLENLIKRTKDTGIFVEVAQEVEELFDVIHSFKAISIEPAVFVVSGEALQQEKTQLIESIQKKCPESSIMVVVNEKTLLYIKESDRISQIHSYFDMEDAPEQIWEKVKDALDVFRMKTLVEAKKKVKSKFETSSIMEEIDTGIIEVDRDCRIVYMNKRANRFTNKEVGELFCPRIYNNYEQNCSNCMLDRRIMEDSKRSLMYKDQAWAQVEIKVKNSGSRILSYTDITNYVERDRVNLALREIALKEVDPRNTNELAKMIVLMAKRFVKIQGLQMIRYDEIFPKVVFSVGEIPNSTFLEQIYREDKENGFMEQSGQRYRYQRLKDYRLLLISYSAKRIGFDLMEEFVQGILDIMVAKIKQSETYYRRVFDEQKDDLTSAYNRVYFSKVMEYLYSERRSQEKSAAIHALTMVDIRNLNHISSVYGKEISDTVVKEISERILRRIRSHDLVARIGANEFAILLELNREDGLGVFLERLKSGLEGDKEEGVSVLTGIGVIKDIEEYHNYSELMMEADLVLHEQPSEIIEVAAGLH